MALAQLLTQTYFDNTLLAYSWFLGAVIVGLILGKVFTFVNIKVLKKLTSKTAVKFDDLILELTERPIIVYIGVGAAYLGWKTLSFPNFPEIPVYTNHIFFLVLVLNTAWLLSRTIKSIIKEYVTPIASKTKSDLDDTVIPILTKLSGFMIYALAFIMVLDHFGQEIGPMLAGLGIGGLAFALAAKDLLANIFGSITVIMDKPFRKGDWIKIGDVDGIVEEINIRTTIVKSWANPPNDATKPILLIRSRSSSIATINKTKAIPISA